MSKSSTRAGDDFEIETSKAFLTTLVIGAILTAALMLPDWLVHAQKPGINDLLVLLIISLAIFIRVYVDEFRMRSKEVNDKLDRIIEQSVDMKR